MLQINGWRPHTTRRIHLCMIVDITRFVAVNQSSPTRLIWRNFPGLLRNQQLIVSPTELTSSLSQFELLHSNQRSSSGNIIMKFAIVSILLYVFAENALSVSGSPRRLSKGSKVKNYNYETNPVSTQHTVITISHVVPTDPEPIDNRNDNQGDPIPVPVVQCKECTDEGEFYSNVEHIYQFSNFLFRVSH